MNCIVKNQTFQKQPILKQQAIQVKKFIQDAYHIDYSNTSQLFTQNTKQTADVKINNYLCYQDGRAFYKIIQVMYDDKLIRLQDKFQIIADCLNLMPYSKSHEQKSENKEKNSSRNNQKVRIFSRKTTIVEKEDKKDKKNIVKNIVKIFIAYLQKKQKNESKIQIAFEQLLNLLGKQNFNNRLIRKIITNSQINRQFHKFIVYKASQQIKLSRIHDKQSHYEALQIYKNLLLKEFNKIDKSNQNLNQSQQNQQLCKNQQNSYELSQNSINYKHNEAEVKITQQSNQILRRSNIVLIPNTYIVN